MLTQHRIPVCLALVSTDLPICTGVETVATLYPKGQECFHLLLAEPSVQEEEIDSDSHDIFQDIPFTVAATTPRLLWLEFSPYRASMTMQGNGQFSYRHFWERGVYGSSCYWLQNNFPRLNSQIRLRNFTRDLTVQGNSLPKSLRINYELWSENLRLGHYVLSLDIQY
jgi:hypothetical protein